MKSRNNIKDTGRGRRKQKSKGKTGKVGDISLRKTSDPTHSVGAKLKRGMPTVSPPPPLACRASSLPEQQDMTPMSSKLFCPMHHENTDAIVPGTSGLGIQCLITKVKGLSPGETQRTEMLNIQHVSIRTQVPLLQTTYV